jgi:hypothetical protein
MLNKQERNKIKKQIVKSLTHEATGIFDNKEGYAKYNGTDLTMVMACVYEALSKLTNNDERTAKDMQDEINLADELHYDECQDLRIQVAELNRKLTMKRVN